MLDHDLVGHWVLCPDHAKRSNARLKIYAFSAWRPHGAWMN
jgi:hypothetical protein